MCRCQRGACKEVGSRLFSVVLGNRTGGNNKNGNTIKCKGMFFSTVRVIRHLNGFLREFVESPTMETFRSHLDIES